MRPNRLVVRAYLSRGAQLWLVTRLMLSCVFLLARTNPIRLSSPAIIAIILLTVGLSFLETNRRRERALLSNLGVHPLSLGALFAGPAIIGELALRLGGAALQ